MQTISKRYQVVPQPKTKGDVIIANTKRNVDKPPVNFKMQNIRPTSPKAVKLPTTPMSDAESYKS